MKPVRLLLAMLLLATLLLGGMFSSETGLRFIGKAITRYSAGMVSIGQIHGRLVDKFTVEAFRFGWPGADISVDKVKWSWKPQRLLLGELWLETLSASGIQVTLQEYSTAKTEESNFVLPKTLLPLRLVLENFLVEGVEIVDSGGDQLLEIATIDASLYGNGRQLNIDRIAMEGPDTGFTLHGSLEAGPKMSVDVVGKWHLAGFGFHPLQGSFSALGPLEAPHIEFGVNSSGVIRAGIDIVDLLEEPKWTGKVEARGVDLSALILSCPQILLTTVDGDMHGDFGSYRGLVTARASWDTLQGIELVGQIDGDGLGIDFESLRIEREDSLAVVEKGSINWRDIFGWAGRFRLENFNPAAITELLPGKISSEFASRGEVTENGVAASFNITEMAGVLRDQKVSMNGNVILGETDVHTDGLIVRSGDIQGVVKIDKATFSWAQTPSWAAEIRLENFDPSLLHPEFYGRVNAVFSGSGQQGDKGPVGAISIREISGSLRGNDLAGGGDIQLKGNTFTTTGLTLTSGLSELILQGRAGDDLGITLGLRTPDLSSLLPGTRGEVSIKGSLTGNITSPRLDLDIEGGGLHYNDYEVGQLQAQFQTDLTKGGVFVGKVAATALGLSGAGANGVEVEFSGSLDDHEIMVTADTPMLLLEGRARGMYDSREWRGTLSQLLLEVSGFGPWKQQHDVDVTLGSSIRVDELCVENGPANICLGGSLLTANELQWRVNTRAKSVPLEFINTLHLIPVQLQGLVDGEIEAAGDGAAVSSASLLVSIPKSSISHGGEEQEVDPFQLIDLSVKFDLTEAVLQGSLFTLTENGGQVEMDIAVEDVGRFPDSLQNKHLVGLVELRDFDLGTVDGFTAYGVESVGLLNGQLILGGTLRQPTVHGNAAIEDGGIELLNQGVVLKEVALSIAGEGRQARVSGTATSGPGQMLITGEVLYDESGLDGEIHLRGKDFLLVDLPEYTFRVASDIQLNFNSTGAEISGWVTVPYGLLTPEEMVDSVGVSEDVVFVNGEEEEALVKRWPVMLDLDVILGDDVRLEGYGLTGRLGGRLRVHSTQDNILAGSGQLDLIDGGFSVYGRALNIERGRVLFTGGPIDNPGLDVRAQSTVSDKQARGKGYTVGVDISGLVHDLQFNLFSDPYMDDTEILSLMVVGHSLANTSGDEGDILRSAAASLGLEGGSKLVQGFGNFLPIDDLHFEGSQKKEDFSLVVGKRVTQDLYIGYDMNMFSQLGQFRVRYDLQKGFSVETTSSSEATGADLFYSFER